MLVTIQRLRVQSPSCYHYTNLLCVAVFFGSANRFALDAPNAYPARIARLRRIEGALFPAN